MLKPAFSFDKLNLELQGKRKTDDRKLIPNVNSMYIQWNKKLKIDIMKILIPYFHYLKKEKRKTNHKMSFKLSGL